MDYFKTKINIGAVLNIKMTIEYAKGKYIFLHSDDDFLLYANSLEEVYKKIKKHNPGYIRVNYVCLSPDKKRIFDFKANKSFIKNQYLLPFSENKKVIKFILDSDAAFVTGIIFLNNLPSNIKIVKAEPFWGIEIIFYTAKNYGAYLISKPHIIASWSKLRNYKKDFHLLYSLINGALPSENYLNTVKKQLDTNSYDIFLHNQLMGLYVYMFLLVKLYVGNKNMLKLSARICSLYPKMKKSLVFWIFLFLAIILPKFFIKIIKNLYLHVYMRFSNCVNSQQIFTRFKKLEEKYNCFLQILCLQ